MQEFRKQEENRIAFSFILEKIYVYFDIINLKLHELYREKFLIPIYYASVKTFLCKAIWFFEDKELFLAVYI